MYREIRDLAEYVEEQRDKYERRTASELKKDIRARCKGKAEMASLILAKMEKLCLTP